MPRTTGRLSGTIYLVSYPNLKNRWLTIQSQLMMGRHVNSQLRKDWNELGPDAFNYEVLEEKEAGEVADVRWELKQMEKQWLMKLQPFGDRGEQQTTQGMI